MHPDDINSASAHSVASAAISLADRLQSLDTRVAPHAVASLFLILADHHQFDPRLLFEKTERLMRDADREGRPAFLAAKYYVEKYL